jgi:hypothetical protein
MAGLVPAIQAVVPHRRWRHRVDARHKAGHDGDGGSCAAFAVSTARAQPNTRSTPSPISSTTPAQMNAEIQFAT